MLSYVRTYVYDIYIIIYLYVWNTQIYNAIKCRSLYFIEIYYTVTITTFPWKWKYPINDSVLKTVLKSKFLTILISTICMYLVLCFSKVCTTRLGQPFLLFMYIGYINPVISKFRERMPSVFHYCLKKEVSQTSW